MTSKLDHHNLTELRPRLTVIGIGGAGSNAVNNMIASGLEGVEFIVANTDAQSLANSSAEHRIQLGVHLTEGLGAGARPEIGQAAAEEAIDEIRKRLSGSHMVFVAAGMGGGTGTGAAEVIARVAGEIGALTVGVVTKPFQFEGSRRMRAAEAGIKALAPYVDTLIVIPNQNLFRIANEKTTFSEAFLLADQVLYSGIACIVDLIIKDGLINLDFADVKAVMANMGTAMMGTGEATGEKRAVTAAEEAIANPLLDDISLSGAKGLLVSITAGSEMTLYEVDEAATRVRQEVQSDANIIVGATFDDSMGERMRVSIVASGMDRRDASGLQVPPPLTRKESQSGAAGAVYTDDPIGRPHVPNIAKAPETTGSAARDGASAEGSVGGGGGALDQGVTQPGAKTDAPALYVESSVSVDPDSADKAPLPPHMPQDAAADGERSAAAGTGCLQQADTELARALSEAIKAAAADAQSNAERKPSHQPAAADSAAQAVQSVAGAWSAPSGAVFEDAPPPIGHTPPQQLGVDPQSESTAPVDAAFAPMPPAEVGQPQRRLPEVEDFSHLAQQEYRTKMERYGADQANAEQQRPAAEPSRKRSFLERLTGAKRDATIDSPVNSKSRNRQSYQHEGENNGQISAHDIDGRRKATGSDP